jgi:hypothetical protein
MSLPIVVRCRPPGATSSFVASLEAVSLLAARSELSFLAALFSVPYAPAAESRTLRCPWGFSAWGSGQYPLAGRTRWCLEEGGSPVGGSPSGRSRDCLLVPVFSLPPCGAVRV